MCCVMEGCTECAELCVAEEGVDVVLPFLLPVQGSVLPWLARVAA